MCVVLPTGVLLFLRKGGGGPRGENRKFPTFGQFGNIWSIWQHLVNLATFFSIWQHLLNLATLPIICLSSLSEARLAESPTSSQLSDRNVSGAPTNTDFPPSLELPTQQQAARQRGLKLECAQINWHLCLLEPNGKVALKMKHCQTPRRPHVLHIMLQNGGGIHILKAKTLHAVPVTLYLLYVGIVVRNCHKCYGSQLKGLY